MHFVQVELLPLLNRLVIYLCETSNYVIMLWASRNCDVVANTIMTRSAGKSILMYSAEMLHYCLFLDLNRMKRLGEREKAAVKSRLINLQKNLVLSLSTTNINKS